MTTQPPLPDRLQGELDALGDEMRHRLAAAMPIALADSLRETLNQFKTFRRLLLYLNTQAEWDAMLQVIHDGVHADAVQIVCLEGLDDLSYHVLPPDQPIDDDLANLLHDGLTIDDQLPDGTVRLGMLLAVNDDLLGVLMVVRHNGAAFGEYDRLIVANFADELAIALHNLELYGLIREQANRLASMIRTISPDEGYP